MACVGHLSYASPSVLFLLQIPFIPIIRNLIFMEDLLIHRIPLRTSLATPRIMHTQYLPIQRPLATKARLPHNLTHLVRWRAGLYDLFRDTVLPEDLHGALGDDVCFGED